MLSRVNDPAALRQIVQNVQAAANSSQQNTAVGSANPLQNTAQPASAINIRSSRRNRKINRKLRDSKQLRFSPVPQR